MYQEARIRQQVKDFTDLIGWQEAHRLTLDLYEATDPFPEQEKYMITGQLRRAAASTGANISEGFSRRSRKEKIQFYGIALGSISEVQNHLHLARDLGYLTTDETEALLVRSVRVHKLLNGLIRTTRDRT